MSDMQNEVPKAPDAVEVECPHCHKKFWHKITDVIEGALEGLGNAIGEAKFDQ